MSMYMTMHDHATRWCDDTYAHDHVTRHEQPYKTWAHTIWCDVTCDVSLYMMIMSSRDVHITWWTCQACHMTVRAASVLELDGGLNSVFFHKEFRKETGKHGQIIILGQRSISLLREIEQWKWKIRNTGTGFGRTGWWHVDMHMTWWWCHVDMHITTWQHISISYHKR